MSQQNTQQMSKREQNEIWSKAISASKERFDNTNLAFDQEQVFATQMLLNNDYLMDVAIKDPSSLRMAMFNVAAVGLTLNPNQGLAYLVPRRNKSKEPAKVRLDISYRGLIAIGVDTGAIRWAKAELVYENDKFLYKGPADKPEHQCDPFATDRGAVRGGYCIAELPTGGFLVEAMSRADMDKIRDKSEAYKNKVGPWVDWEDQMQLKAVVKRASKWWPVSTQRFAKALQILNEENGEGLSVIQGSAKVINQLPAPPSADDVPVAVRNSVKQLIDSAASNSAFEACRELMESRYNDPGHLSFALHELEQVESANANDSQKLENAG